MGALARPPPLFFCLPVQKKEDLLVASNETLVEITCDPSLLSEERGPKEERGENSPLSTAGPSTGKDEKNHAQKEPGTFGGTPSHHRNQKIVPKAWETVS